MTLQRAIVFAKQRHFSFVALRVFWKVQQTSLVRWKAPQNSPFTGQCKSPSLWPLLSRRALTCEGGNSGALSHRERKTPVTCTFQNSPSENPLSATYHFYFQHGKNHWEVKGRFRKRVVLAMYPCSGFRSGGTCECTLVPVFVPGEHPNVPSFRFSFRGNIRQSHPFGNQPFRFL